MIFLVLLYFYCDIACLDCNAMCIIVVCEYSINMVVVIKPLPIDLLRAGKLIYHFFLFFKQCTKRFISQMIFCKHLEN